MTSRDADQLPQPTDRFEDALTAIEPDPSADADTEGHSMLSVELARTMNQDRTRETAKLDRDSERTREAHSRNGGGIFKRFGRR